MIGAALGPAGASAKRVHRIKELGIGEAVHDLTAGADGNMWFTSAPAGRRWRYRVKGPARSYTTSADLTPGGATFGSLSRLYMLVGPVQRSARVKPSSTVAVVTFLVKTRTPPATSRAMGD